MKVLNKVLFAIVLALTAIITYFASHLFFTIIVNYEALSRVSLAGGAMYLFVASLIAIIFYYYKAKVNNMDDVFLRRHYSLIVAILSLLGVVFAILAGTYIYHDFFGPYILNSYPFIMLIVHVVLLLLSSEIFVKSLIQIKKENLVCERKSNVKHVFKTIGFSLFFIFALARCGAFLIMPVYFSSYDSIYVLPYYIQLLVPMAIVVCYLLNKDIIKNNKFASISTFAIFGYTLFSFVYMLILRAVFDKFAPNYVNPLSSIQNLERMISLPASFIIMYLVSFGFTLSNLVILLVKKFKNKKV